MFRCWTEIKTVWKKNTSILFIFFYKFWKYVYTLTNKTFTIDLFFIVTPGHFESSRKDYKSFQSKPGKVFLNRDRRRCLSSLDGSRFIAYKCNVHRETVERKW